jgi:hypothetical protein
MKKLLLIVTLMFCVVAKAQNLVDSTRPPTPIAGGVVIGNFNTLPSCVHAGQIAWYIPEKKFYQCNGTAWEVLGNNFSVEDIDSTQSIDIGDIAAATIEDAFNAFTFTGADDPVQGQESGYVIINCIRNGIEEQYLFLGEGGNYGTSGTETAIASDFTLVDKNVPFQDVWRKSNGTELAINYTQAIRHNGNVTVDKRILVGGSSAYGLLNAGTGNLYLQGNQGVVVKAINPNVGTIELTNSGQLTVLPVENSLKYNVRSYRNFSDSFAANNFKGVNLWLNDVVDFSAKTGDSYHTSLLIDPDIQDSGIEHKAIDVVDGLVDIQSGKLKVGDYTLPSSDGLPGQVQKTDGNGNLTWQDGGGSSNVINEVVINTPTYTATLEEVQNFTTYVVVGDIDVTFNLPEVNPTQTYYITIHHEGTGTVTAIPGSSNVNQVQYAQTFNGLDTDALTLRIREENTYKYHRGDNTTVSAYVDPSSNIILNTTFDDATNVTHDADYNITGGEAVYTHSGGFQWFTFNLSEDMIAGETYTFTMDITNLVSGDARFKIYINQGGSDVQIFNNANYNSGVNIEITVPAGSNATQLKMYTASSSSSFNFDNGTLTQNQ